MRGGSASPSAAREFAHGAAFGPPSAQKGVASVWTARASSPRMDPKSDELPRSEYPRPQFRRSDWLCLNGVWDFEPDPADSGRERGLVAKPYGGRIVVPFCPEAPLSGVGYEDFLNAAWYRRRATVPESWSGRRWLLHFQAADYETTVWIDGEEAGRHQGGFTPFSVDLTGRVRPGEPFEIVARARDDCRAQKPQGKQSNRFANESCFYTRTTGIWQTVWMEPVAARARLLRPRVFPSLARRSVRVEAPVAGDRRGLAFRATLSDERGTIDESVLPADADFQPGAVLSIPRERVALWEPGQGRLYELTLELLDESGAAIDRIDSYAGLRSVAIDGKRILVNGEPVFQRLVLDQGYYPDGIMTAPSDAALVRDIELSLRAGFNGARLHQKVFEERFLYHADRLGYLVWGEFGDWSQRLRSSGSLQNPAYVKEWIEALERDLSHPSIVGWCPLNETRDVRGDRVSSHEVVLKAMYRATKAMDLTRPVLDASGYTHREEGADVYDSHNYTQDPAKFKEQVGGLSRGEPFVNKADDFESVPYSGQPYFVSEFGGIWWNPEAAADEPSWGYGERPKSEEEFYARFEGLCRALLEDPDMFGYCYTQLTDVFQEQNGVVRFDRGLKLDLDRLRAIQQQVAACEREAAKPAG